MVVQSRIENDLSFVIRKENMIYSLVLIVSFQTVVINSYLHEKPLHNTLWSERCKKRAVVLNDCNWCWCNERQRYHCEARVCEEIDMFGHFKDAIQAIDVGMEGHGVWRSSPTPCSPGIHYRRAATLCVCNEGGNWPNPVCRDIFRVLHSVEHTSLTHPTSNYTCSPTKLYVVGCNVCFCPSSGYLDPNLCTQNNCHKDDPILKANSNNIARIDDVDDDNLEIYASCTPNAMYNIGCMPCKCLKNNRLLCETCSKNKNKLSDHKESENECRARGTNVVFETNCNLCYCDENERKICTVRKCIKDQPKLDYKNKGNFVLTSSPVDDEDCTPGTKFYKDCNVCQCIKRSNGKKLIQCTKKMCYNTSSIDIIKSDCVLNTAYEIKCMVCHCREENGEKVQTCYTKASCTDKKPLSVSKLSGSCEPFRTYNDDCNPCRCLSDGESLLCATKKCVKKDAVSVEVVPIKRTQRNICPEGMSFRLKCNLCYCLSNNNAMCTTAECYKNSFKIKPIIN